MQEQMQEQMRAQQMQNPYQGPQAGASNPTSFESGKTRTHSAGNTGAQKDDYIDFEEIKEG